MMSAIAQVLEQYRAQGYAVLRGFFAPGEVAAMAAAFDRHWATGMAHRASFRHGNLFYRQGDDARLGRIVRLVQWASYVQTGIAIDLHRPESGAMRLLPGSQAIGEREIAGDRAVLDQAMAEEALA